MDEVLDEYETCISTDCPCKAERRKSYGCNSPFGISDQSSFPMMMGGINSKNLIIKNCVNFEHKRTWSTEIWRKKRFKKMDTPSTSASPLMKMVPDSWTTCDLILRRQNSSSAASTRTWMKPWYSKIENLMHKNEFFQGIFITPKDLYLQTNFNYFDTDYARSNRHYFVYYSESYGEPIGFSEDQRIRLQGSDEFDCQSQGNLLKNINSRRFIFRTSWDKMPSWKNGRS